MCGSIVFIPASLSSVFQQLIDVCYLACHLLMIMIGLCVLENEYWVEELFVDVFWSEISAAHYEDFG